MRIVFSDRTTARSPRAVLNDPQANVDVLPAPGLAAMHGEDAFAAGPQGRTGLLGDRQLLVVGRVTAGGGGEYAALIFRIWATSVGSLGIQFAITIRPPGLVTRTISLATSNGFGANIAPKMLTTRSNERSASSWRLDASPS